MQCRNSVPGQTCRRSILVLLKTGVMRKPGRLNDWGRITVCSLFTSCLAGFPLVMRLGARAVKPWIVVWPCDWINLTMPVLVLNTMIQCWIEWLNDIQIRWRWGLYSSTMASSANEGDHYHAEEWEGAQPIRYRVRIHVWKTQVSRSTMVLIDRGSGDYGMYEQYIVVAERPFLKEGDMQSAVQRIHGCITGANRYKEFVNWLALFNKVTSQQPLREAHSCCWS